jgi:hypothetical protein
MTTSERIKNYLVTTKDLYVKLGGLGAIKIFGYSDAAYMTATPKVASEAARSWAWTQELY